MTLRTGSNSVEPVGPVQFNIAVPRTGQRANRPNRLNGPKGLNGLTLIEILISVAILASAAVVVLQALARSAYALALAHNRLQASAFCASKMAELELALSEGQHPKSAGEFVVDRDRFAWRIETSAAEEEPDLELLTLTVSWHQGRTPYESSVSAVRRVAAGEE